MGWLTDWLDGWLKDGLIDAIMGNFAGMFDSINAQVSDIAFQVGQTPEEFHSGVFSLIRALSETAVIPIAGMILTFVLCYELIQLIIEKNNMHEFDIYNLWKWMFKAFIAIFLLTNVFDIVMGIFGLAQNVINQSAGVIIGNLNLNSAATMAQLEAMLQEMSSWELIGVWLQSFILNICLTAITICIFVIVFGRMIEIFLTVSVAPIPFSTMVNREWGQIGNNYLKALFALAFQGFLILVCVAIYASLVQNIPAADNIHGALWGTAGYTVLLCFALFKTGSLSKGLFGAH